MSFWKALTRVTKNVVLAPVDIVKDVATVGGMATGKNRPYSADRAENLKDSLADLLDEIEDIGE